MSNLKRPRVGMVVDNNDPDKLFRVKVSIPLVTSGIDVKDLPWYPLIKNATSNNNIGGVPELSSWVEVSFDDGTIYNGKVTGFYPGKPQL